MWCGRAGGTPGGAAPTWPWESPGGVPPPPAAAAPASGAPPAAWESGVEPAVCAEKPSRIFQGSIPFEMQQERQKLNGEIDGWESAIGCTRSASNACHSTSRDFSRAATSHVVAAEILVTLMHTRQRAKHLQGLP